jgi:hypothetical protein
MLEKGLAPILLVMLHLIVPDKYSMLLKGPRSHTSSNALITSSRLVLYVTNEALLPHFL